jgi:hypothetical protein
MKRSCALNVSFTAMAADDVEPVRSVVTFEDIGRPKTRVRLKGTFPSAEERARVIREYGADEGMVQTRSRLGQYGDAQSRRIVS